MLFSKVELEQWVIVSLKQLSGLCCLVAPGEPHQSQFHEALHLRRVPKKHQPAQRCIDSCGLRGVQEMA